MVMYIEAVTKRNSPPAMLLRESYREDGKVRKRTLANLSCLPDEVVEGLKVLPRGGVVAATGRTCVRGSLKVRARPNFEALIRP
jgi:hypothetical protein